MGGLYLAASVFAASLLFGFAHLVQDVHDIKRRVKRDDAGDEIITRTDGRGG